MSETYIFQLFSTIGLLIPIGTLIWKAAKQAGKIESLTDRVEKLEVNYKTDIAEIKTNITQINISFVELRTAVEFIKDTIKDGTR